MALNKIISEGIKDSEVKLADMADDSVGVTELSATGTASSSTYLRGDNAWATPPDTTTPADESVTLAKFAHGDGSNNGKFLRANNGADPSWETVAQTDTTYSISCVDGDNTDEEKIRLTAGGSGSGTDDIVLEAGTGLSIARSSDKITFTNTSTGGVTSDAQGNTVGGTSSGDSFTGTDAEYNTLYGINSGTAITSGDSNVAVGQNALDTNTTGSQNVAIGVMALDANDTTNNNVAVGYHALKANTAANNIAIGVNAGLANTSGNKNTVVGYNAFKANTTTNRCTAVGNEALNASTQDACTAVGNEAGKGITNGDHNTAIGNEALKGDGTNAVTGAANVAVGSMCMQDNTSGGNNTSVGYKSMENNTTGGSNVSMGWKCMDANTTGSDNVAIGREALVQNQTANYNVCIGNYAGRALQNGADYNVAIGNIAFGNSGASGMVGDKNVAVGFDAMSGPDLADCYANSCLGWATMHKCTSGSRNSAIGEGAGYYITSGGNNHCIGYNAGQSSSPSGSITTGSDNFVLGNNSIANLYCADTSISSSDERDKTDITDWTHGLDWINKLKPITYRWDKRSWYLAEGEDDITKVTRDGSKKRARLHLGFKAQDILAVEQSFGYAGKKDDMLTVNLNEDDTAYGMKYERLVVVLTKAVQELSAKNDALEARIATLESA